MRLITAWGELLWDRLPGGPRLGGAAANFAYHATCLGADVALVSRIGNDSLGAEALCALAEMGVETAQIQQDPDLPTGTVTVTLGAGEPHYQIATGVAWDNIQLTAAVESQLIDTDVFYFGTLAQRTPKALEHFERAVAVVPEAGWRLCDLNLRPVFGSGADVVTAALRAANVVKVSAAELDTLGELFAVRDVVDWLSAVHGIEVVAVTRGAAGSSLYGAGVVAHHPGCEAGGKGDPVGAGDAFCAVLAVGLARGLDPKKINAAANRYAAGVVSAKGAMPAMPAELRQILEPLG